MRVVLLLALSAVLAGQPKPIPRLQAVPEPYQQISFQRDGAELARYHYGPSLERPFLYPIYSPSGRPLTRMGHPRDPQGHSHHNSVWISHKDVNGLSFWEDRNAGRIVHQSLDRIEDEDGRAFIVTRNAWVAPGGGRTVMNETRTTSVETLGNGEWMLTLQLEFTPQGHPVVFGKTPLGPFAVRLAKTLGVNDGGGLVRNSEGGVNESGTLWKRARWVDYSGPSAPDLIEGVTLFDHPMNPGHPSVFHVRNDGWMGVAISAEEPLTLPVDGKLILRYALYVHRGRPAMESIERRWQSYAGLR